MARKHCRSRVRSRGNVVLNAYSRMVKHFGFRQGGERWRDWTFRTISQRAADELVALGDAIAVRRRVDGEIRVVGYRATQPARWERPSPCTLTFGTMLAVGKRAQGGRLTRHERDETVKFDVWGLIGDTKAPAVRPRMSPEDISRAEALLASGGRRTA